MLFLNVKIGDTVKIGEDIILTVVNIMGKEVRIAFEAPTEAEVIRNELCRGDRGFGGGSKVR